MPKKTEYQGDNFSVRIERRFREAVVVVYTHGGNELELPGELIGQDWSGIQVMMPQELDRQSASNIAKHLEIAFQALGQGYVIARRTGVEEVSESERDAAITTLREIGWQAEVPSDQNRVQLRAIAGAQKPGGQAPGGQARSSMKELMEAIRGTRQQIEVLAKSEGF